jgi:hypothetical protein
MHRFASHSPEEMRQLSNRGHWLEGSLLVTVSILAFLNYIGVDWAGTVWPILLVAAGVLLLILIYPFHPVADWSLIWHDPQQRQHTMMAVVVVVAGTAELAGLNYAWPLAAMFIGMLFLTHSQHGSEHAIARLVFVHRILGSTIVVAGLLRLGEVITDATIFAFLWPLVTLAAGVQLLLYREPSGAFEAPGERGNHH